jgi:hypothetical protein
MLARMHEELCDVMLKSFNSNFLLSLHLSELSFLKFCRPFNSLLVRFEVFTAVTIKNGVLWDVTLCASCKNRRFTGT